MIILGLETAGVSGSVAVLEDDRVRVELPLAAGERSAQALAPHLQQALAAAQVTPSEVQLVAVTVGPGSFTGLRVGVVTAKMFAYAVGCELVGVNTLEAIARGCGRSGRIVTALDAQRGELFWAVWEREASGELSSVSETQLGSIDAVLAASKPDDFFVGQGFAKYREQLTGRLMAETFEAAKASDVARVGRAMFARGATTSAVDLVPNYYRRAAAEEQWDKRTASA